MRSNVFLFRARVSRAREDRRSSSWSAPTKRSGCRDRRPRAAGVAPDGSRAVLSAQRRGLARRRELAHQRHHDRAAELPEAHRQLANDRAVVVAARHADAAERVASTLIASRILQGDAAPASAVQAERLSRRQRHVGAGGVVPGELRRARQRRGLSDDGHAGLPAELTRHTMKRLNFLLGTVSGLAVVANGDHVFAQALAQSPLPGLPGGAEPLSGARQLKRRKRRFELRRAARQPAVLSNAPVARDSGKRRAGDRCDASASIPKMQSFKAHVRQGHRRDRARRRLPERRPFALPLERDLADRRARTATSTPAGSAAISTRPRPSRQQPLQRRRRVASPSGSAGFQSHRHSDDLQPRRTTA